MTSLQQEFADKIKAIERRVTRLEWLLSKESREKKGSNEHIV